MEQIRVRGSARIHTFNPRTLLSMHRTENWCLSQGVSRERPVPSTETATEASSSAQCLYLKPRSQL